MWRCYLENYNSFWDNAKYHIYRKTVKCSDYDAGLEQKLLLFSHLSFTINKKHFTWLQTEKRIRINLKQEKSYVCVKE